MIAPPAPLQHFADLALLIQARHPLILLETLDDERAEALLEHLADHLRLPYYVWSEVVGLHAADRQQRHAHAGGRPLARGYDPQELYDTRDPARCLEHIGGAGGTEAIYYLRGMVAHLDTPGCAARLNHIARALQAGRGAVILTAPTRTPLPTEVERLVSVLTLEELSEMECYRFASDIVRDVKTRLKVTIDLDSDGMSALLAQLRGLTSFEIRKILTEALLADGVLSRGDIARVVEAKRRIIARSGVLEYFPADQDMGSIAGLGQLKSWLHKRRDAFLAPNRARSFGLDPPKGLLLVGVPGCGKSLCAKATANAWRVPLVRLDPANLYHRFMGDSEKNLQRAIALAEAMAPLVLWIDEVEKAFGAGGDQDGGTAQRVFGMLLSWMQEKKETVFVVATCNQIDRLPPEMLRKGRFDEVFFVDLPDAETRKAILEIHLRRRRRDPGAYDLAVVAASTNAFSGAELEQLVVSALYDAYAGGTTLSTDSLLEACRATRPLATTMADRVTALRHSLQGRAVDAA